MWFMKSIREVTDLRGKHVFVRASLNEPIENDVLKSDFRLEKMLPLLKFLRGAGALTIVAGHLSGDPQQKTLIPIARYFQDKFPMKFIEDMFSSSAKDTLASMHDGDAVLIENLRRYPGEEENDMSFAKKLSVLADIYVNEDFSTSHRVHASIVLLPKLLPSYIGLQFEQEFKHLSQAINPPHQSLVIIGGAKPETKMPLIRQFLNVADKVFVGGLSANEFFVASGYNIGSSLVSGKDLGVEKLLKHPKLLLPIDVRVLAGGTTTIVKKVDELELNDRIVDVGPETLVSIASVISESASVVWNGPLGDSDRAFIKGSEHLAHIIADSHAMSIIGGGDTVSVVKPLGIEDRITFLSTAGAAMVDFLVHGTLPGIKALN